MRERLATRWGAHVVLDNDAQLRGRRRARHRGRPGRGVVPAGHHRHRHRRRAGPRRPGVARRRRHGRRVRTHAGRARRAALRVRAARLLGAVLQRQRPGAGGPGAGSARTSTGPQVTAPCPAGDRVARQAFAHRRHLARRRAGQPGGRVRPGAGGGRRRSVGRRRPAAGAGPSSAGPIAGRVRASRPCHRSCPPRSAPRPAPSARRMLARRSSGGFERSSLALLATSNHRYSTAPSSSGSRGPRGIRIDQVEEATDEAGDEGVGQRARAGRCRAPGRPAAPAGSRRRPARRTAGRAVGVGSGGGGRRDEPVLAPVGVGVGVVPALPPARPRDAAPGAVSTGSASSGSSSGRSP